MGNYKLTRQDAADSLEISVRSVDRYIKSGKLRAKKKGKIVYVHKEDIENMSGKSGGVSHVIVTDIPKKEKKSSPKEATGSQDIVRKSDYTKLTKTFEKVYGDLRKQIEKKDDIIQKLSIQVGQSQEQVRHSISVTEHNRSQMLLEESKTHIAKQMSTLSDEKEDLMKQLKNEKFDKKVLIVFVFILLGLAAYFWFQSV